MAAARVTDWDALFGRAVQILGAAPREGVRVESWSLGGAGVLMRRYRHRVSRGVDVFLPDPRLLGVLSPRLNQAIEALAPDYLEHGRILKLFFPEGEISFVASGFLTPYPTNKAWIGNQEVDVETSAEIIAKKIWHRATEFSARDFFDLALVSERDSAALTRIGHFLAGGRRALRQRIAEHGEELREDFAALNVLSYQPTYQACMDAVLAALADASALPIPKTEQRCASYRVEPVHAATAAWRAATVSRFTLTPPCRSRRRSTFRRRHRPLALDDQAVVLRLSVPGEVEHRALVGIA